MLCGTGDLSEYDFSLERSKHNQTKLDCLWVRPGYPSNSAMHTINVDQTRPVTNKTVRRL